MKLFPPLFPTADPFFENKLRSDPVARFRFEQETRLDPFGRHERAPNEYNLRGEDKLTEFSQMVAFKDRQESSLTSSLLNKQDSRFLYGNSENSFKPLTPIAIGPKKCALCGGSGNIRYGSERDVAYEQKCFACSGAGRSDL